MPKLGEARFTYDPRWSTPTTAVLWCNVERATRSRVLNAVSDVAEQHSIVKDISANIDDGFVIVTIVLDETTTDASKFAFIKKLVAETRELDEDEFRCNLHDIEASMAVSARGSNTNET